MKHSSPVKYPSSLLIVSISIVGLSFIFVSWYTINSWRTSQQAKDGVDGAVEQLDQGSYQQAKEILKNKNK